MVRGGGQAQCRSVPKLAAPRFPDQPSETRVVDVVDDSADIIVPLVPRARRTREPEQGNQVSPQKGSSLRRSHLADEFAAFDGAVWNPPDAPQRYEVILPLSAPVEVEILRTRPCLPERLLPPPGWDLVSGPSDVCRWHPLPRPRPGYAARRLGGSRLELVPPPSVRVSDLPPVALPPTLAELLRGSQLEASSGDIARLVDRANAEDQRKGRERGSRPRREQRCSPAICCHRLHEVPRNRPWEPGRPGTPDTRPSCIPE